MPDFSSLTPDQEQAIRHRGGPLMVLAGPGTGKTRTLTCRIFHMIAEGVARSDQILAITFTNKAAEEMGSRLTQFFSEIQAPSMPWISTFHGFCYRFLQENFPVPFQLLSEQEALAILKKTVREKVKDFPARSFKELARRISLAKNSWSPSERLQSWPPWDTYPEWTFLYQAFQEKLAAQKSWDFDDLLIQAVSLLENNPDLRASLQDRFPYLFIDEFQDMNPIQYRLFQLLTRREGEWMVIGDPNQSIYGFRGANAGFFARLRKEYPLLTEISLTRTFRLDQTILNASSLVLEGASEHQSIPLKSIRKGEPRVPVTALSCAEEEGEYIAGVIEAEMGGLTMLAKDQDHGTEQAKSRSFADFVVLYRLHAQGDLLAKALVKKGIPFKKLQEVHWAERPEIRAFLKKLRFFPSRGLSPGAALEKVLFENAELLPLEEAGIEAFKKLRLRAATFQGPLEEFIETLSIQTGLDTYEPDQETVKLLTLHASKGLEFPVVIISGCEENLLPLTLLKESDPEEERRLFYVGLTRAREKLLLTWAKRRTLFGQRLDQRPSPFLENMEALLKVSLSPGGNKKPVRPRKKQMSLF
jgi:DNA helicase-2/ATP-dependent DNA helicase PcrA